MSRVRVFIVDDSVVIRQFLVTELGREPDIEIADTAVHGRNALAKLARISVDVIILDVEMPELDGLQTLKALRKTHPRLPVIMFSALTAMPLPAKLLWFNFRPDCPLGWPLTRMPSGLAVIRLSRMVSRGWLPVAL